MLIFATKSQQPMKSSHSPRRSRQRKTRVSSQLLSPPLTQSQAVDRHTARRSNLSSPSTRGSCLSRRSSPIQGGSRSGSSGNKSRFVICAIPFCRRNQQSSLRPRFVSANCLLWTHSCSPSRCLPEHSIA